jgi:hypothetical protein
MRIVIEADDGAVVETRGGVADGEGIVDAGPAPAALLKRFSRPPAESATVVVGEIGAIRPERRKKGGEGLNPLRAGEAVAHGLVRGVRAVAEEVPDQDAGSAPKLAARRPGKAKKA